MSWTKLDDLWSEKIEDVVSDHGARWHYIALIQLCSRLEARDGIVNRSKAERCSDLPDPQHALSVLVNAGLLVEMGNRIKVVRAAEHVISEAKANEAERNRENKRRSRAHHNGDHDECVIGDGDKPSNCRHASPSSSVSHSDVTGDKGAMNPHESGEDDHDPQGEVTVTSPVLSGRGGPGRGATSPPGVDLETGEVLDSASTPGPSASTSAPGPLPSFSESPEYRRPDPFGSASSSADADGPSPVDFGEFVQQFRNPEAS